MDTILAATSNFSEENKLRECSLGHVYQVLFAETILKSVWTNFFHWFINYSLLHLDVAQKPGYFDKELAIHLFVLFGMPENTNHILPTVILQCLPWKFSNMPIVDPFFWKHIRELIFQPNVISGFCATQRK